MSSPKTANSPLRRLSSFFNKQRNNSQTNSELDAPSENAPIVLPQDTLPPSLKSSYMSDTFLEAAISKIVWGLYNGKPACMLGIQLNIGEEQQRPNMVAAHCTLEFSRPNDKFGTACLKLVRQLPATMKGPPASSKTKSQTASSPAESPKPGTGIPSWSVGGWATVLSNAKPQASWDLLGDPQRVIYLPQILRVGLILEFGELQPFNLELEVRASYKLALQGGGHGRNKLAVILQPEMAAAALTNELRSYVADGT